MNEEISEDNLELTENTNSKTTPEDLIDKKELKDALWEKTGFQRVLGGYWHNYMFLLFTLVFGLLVLGVLFPNYILPFPEAIGFQSVVRSLFALMFVIFDVGIGTAVVRFVAEYVGSGKIKEAINFIKFFVWFQMITGLIQITVIAIWAFRFAAHINDFAALVWLFLIYSTVQFPGMLGIYTSALEAFQRFDKKNIVVFVQMVFLESTTVILFIFLGRWWGINNPEYGELMGATIGYIMGMYVDDFLAMMLAGKFLADVLHDHGVTLRETIYPDFPKEVAVKAFKYGWKNMAQGIFYQISMLMITAMTIIWLPNYSTIIGLFTIADAVTRVVIQNLPTKAAISEAFNNNKIELTKYYTTSTFKWYGLLTFYLGISILQLIPPVITDVAGAYASASWMIAPLMLSRFFIGPIHFSDAVQQGCDKPEYAAYSLFVQMAVRAIFFYIMLAPNMLPSIIDNYNLAMAYCLADFPSVIAKNIFAWWIIDRKLFKVEINWWQTIITPALAIIPLFFVNRTILFIYSNYIADADMVILIVFVLSVLVFMIFGIPTLIFFPMVGLLGGWDERQLRHLKEAAMMAGPSKILVNLLYAGSNWGFRNSPFRDHAQKHRIKHEEADLQAQELIVLRKIGIEKFK